MPLSQLNVGQRATIAKLLTCGSMRRRLQDLGIVQGTTIECVLKSPSGDPVAYFVRGAMIALRNHDSKGVLVKL